MLYGMKAQMPHTVSWPASGFAFELYGQQNSKVSLPDEATLRGETKLLPC